MPPGGKLSAPVKLQAQKYTTMETFHNVQENPESENFRPGKNKLVILASYNINSFYLIAAKH